MATKAKKPVTKTEEHKEAKRQSVKVPAGKATIEEGSHAIDHMTVLDNHEMPDTNFEPIEDIEQRNQNDLSFWGGSWTWTKSANSYGDKPEDSWFVNPSPTLLAEVMNNAPLIHGACEVQLLGNYKGQLDNERCRHLEFLRSAEDAELVSECLDLLTAYQGRFFESVQQYLGRAASYDNQSNNQNATEEAIEQARMRKVEAGAVCRGWVARLVSLVEAYHSVMSDERAYNLHYDFAPAPDSKTYGLYRWTVSTALNKIGRRLARSVKSGKLDAEKYRIPRPWREGAQKETVKKADEMISDFG